MSMDILGTSTEGQEGESSAVYGQLGQYLATDGSLGGRVAFDFGRPHAGVVVGKRGTGKSYTLGVLAEGLANSSGVVPVVVDPMGVFGGLSGFDIPVVEPRVQATALPPQAWCRILNLDPANSVGTLVWQAADECESLAAMQSWVEEVETNSATRRAASNHLTLAASWDCFSPDGLEVMELLDTGVVVDCTRLRDAALRGVVFAIADMLYRETLSGNVGSLPWLLVDEAHACVSGVSVDAIETLYTRGRAPGASVVIATQRPSALPEVAVSQSDVLIAHRVTSGTDVDALTATRPTYLDGLLSSKLPENRGEALVVDDTTESACTIRIRERQTEHGGVSAQVVN